MRAIDRKLIRNLRSMRGQAVAILLIVACGVASYVTMRTAYIGLLDSRDTYYARYRMADVWAPVKRAPRAEAREIGAIDGVRRVVPRIVFNVSIDLPGVPLPCSGRIVSVPDRREPTLNDLHLLRGRWFDGDGTREVMVHELFAREHGLEPGDTLRVIMNNKKEALRVIAIAQSPEYVYLIRPGEVLPDAKHFAVLWLSTSFAEAVFDYEDACDEFALDLERGAQVDEVLRRVDAELERYGGMVAYARKDQLSHYYLNQEIQGLRAGATMTPAIFLGVAAFVLHMLMGRLVQTQRTQVALMRALGYSGADLVGHYLKLAGLIGLLGAAAGTALGLWFARGLVDLYRQFFSLPVLDFGPDTAVLSTALFVALGFTFLGTIGAVRKVAKLAPAEGMRPEAPGIFHRTLFERARWIWSRLGFATRMVLRNVSRTRLRAAVTIVGISFAAALVVLALFGRDAVAELMDVQFRVMQREDAVVTFYEERGRDALNEVRAMPGMRAVEPLFAVPVKLVHGWRSKRTSITGLQEDGVLYVPRDPDLVPIALPDRGLLLSRKLAEDLDVRRGGRVRVEVLYGRRQEFEAPVADVVDDYVGVSAYATIDQLSGWVGESMALNAVRLMVDRAQADAIGQELKQLPAVAAVSWKERSLESFRTTIGESQDISNTITILFAGVIAFGVVYNAARIALAERQRELGSLRVLGFSQREVASVLVGENLFLVALALLPGLALGVGFCWLLSYVYSTELFRFPFVVRASTMAGTVLVILFFAAVANVLVVRRLRRLDLVEVLKERE